MYAGTRLSASGRGLGALAGQVVGGGCWMEGPNARGCMEYWCENVDSQTGDRVGQPYRESEQCVVHVDARSENVQVPGGPGFTDAVVTLQHRTEYVVPYSADRTLPAVPTPGTPEFDRYVEAARQGTVYRESVAAGAATQTPVFVDAGAFDPARDYAQGYDPRTGERYAAGEDPGFQAFGAGGAGGGLAPSWWDQVAYGAPGAAEVSASSSGGRGLAVPALAAGLLLFAVSRKKGRRR